MDVHLRVMMGADVPLFFRHHRQLPNGGEGEAEFCERWLRMLEDQSFVIRTILVDGQVAGYVANFTQLGKPSISYWLGKQFWGQGVATAALQRFLPLVAERPLYARAASDNAVSHRVLEKCGFEVVGTGRFFSERDGEEVEEVVFALG